MSGHTATPWFLQPHSLTIYNMSHGDTGVTCAVAVALRDQPGVEAAEANAAFICRAVNSHEALVASAKALCAAYPEDDEDNSAYNLWVRYGSEFVAAVKLARATLLLAEPTS